MKQPKVEPAIRAMRKAYRGSTQYQLDRLLAEEGRWKRKATIAQNKLADVRRRINDLCRDVINPKAVDVPGGPKP